MSVNSNLPTPLALRLSPIPQKAYPWLMWCLGVSFAVVQFWTQLAFGHMGAQIMRDFSLDALGLSQLSAAFFYVFVLMQIPSGILIDRFGTANVLKIVVTSLVVGCWLFASAQQLWVAYLGRVLMGFGSAFGFVGMLTLAGGWFSPKKFVMVVAVSEMICLAFVSVGQFVLPIVIENYGWRIVIYTSFQASVVILVGMWLLSCDGPYSFKGKQPGLLKGLKKYLLNAPSLVNASVAACISIMLTVFIPLWGLPFLLRVHELSYVQAGWGVAFVTVGIAVGSVGFGWIASRVPQKRPIIVGATCVQLAVMVLLIVVHPIPLLWLYPLLMVLGLSNSAYIICFAIAKEITPEGYQGVAMSFVNLFCMGGSIVHQPIIGFLLYLHEYDFIIDGVPIYSVRDYQMAFWVLPASLLAGLLFAMRNKH